MEEEEIYIELFDRYNRNEIDRETTIDSLEEMDVSFDPDYELQCYQTAIMLLEQNYLKEIIRNVESTHLAHKKSKRTIFSGLPVML
ncbi:MAG: hypothetical protein HEP71_30955 [Roseivirga sp.]|nr:hypothetical protein [Roseivirga sp.]